MKRGGALLGSFLFFWIAPATVGGWLPWYFTRWRIAPPLFDGAASRWLGAALAAAGAVTVIECFARFALKGLGTPAPVAPTRHLVVSGLYRHVRNPMYVGVTSAIIGQALWFGSVLLLYYGAAVWGAFHLFVLLYEEPTLMRQFGAEYERYRGNVPRWLPRIRPWRGA
jgi:protein-S-isoprenylcysteine O-methyltransferase Ste14